jgi:hypothetical protein
MRVFSSASVGMRASFDFAAVKLEIRGRRMPRALALMRLLNSRALGGRQLLWLG